MVRALRSHGRLLSRCSLPTRRRRTPLVLELPLWLTVGWSQTCQPCRTTRKIFVSSVKRISLWSRWQQKRLTSQTAEVVNNRFTPQYNRFFFFCYKSYRLSTRLRLLHYIVLLTRLQCVVQSSSSRISLLAVTPWRHHLVMILWHNSQQNRFCDASKRVRPWCVVRSHQSWLTQVSVDS